MNIKTCYFVFFLFTTSFAFSQDSHIPSIRDVTKLSIVGLGLSYEKAVGKFQSLFFHGYATTSVSLSWSSTFGTNFSLQVDPAFAVNHRYYYNTKRRKEKGKRIAMNSLNYVAPVLVTTFSKSRISVSHYNEVNRRPIYVLGAVWGMQRNYKSRFSLDLQLGAGVLFTKVTRPNTAGEPISDHAALGDLITDLTLGFWINKREKS